ncbi:hypothetical protein [Acinetobacter beijerinckii]|uniref:hypothetical protein n=1 Tax=Acinetobacter beijerinckii TaxID=262668 RepID=UPI002404E39E|nr:hypothetical protein [Acinetobacter beijerinckii]
MGEEKSNQVEQYTIAFGLTFNKYYAENTFPDTTMDLIDDFLDHYEAKGFKDWEGKVAPSNRVPENYTNRDALIKKANKYNIWHVHIGDPRWETPAHGKFKTSEWVLQLRRLGKKIVLLELSWHNPMLLPNDEILEEDYIDV